MKRRNLLRALILCSCAWLSFTLACATAGSGGTAPGPVATTAVAPTSTPFVHFGLNHISASQTCASSFTVLPSLTVVLDSETTNVTEDWSAVFTEQDPFHTEPWGSSTPPTGSIPPNGMETIQITPAANLCNQLQNTPGPTAYHVTIQLSHPAAIPIIFTDTITSPIPG